ncbi:hypothetical protein [Photobacterium salinisoli]|uniref:hypothetical protein n=1 Tax=Photobacterium salinisoli TaxID=1616783 RepID=UPI000EA206B1|nr:hypothetical protein [Photobacterium salinisoli]
MFATRMTLTEQRCLMRLEQQLVKNQGFISLSAFDSDHAEILRNWQQQGHLVLNADSISEIPTELVTQRGITHGCQLSDELWVASASLRRIIAHGL